MKCKKCGKYVKKKWKYCNFCGSKLESVIENNSNDEEIKNSFLNNYKFLIIATIISTILSIIVYFFRIDIIYHLEYGDVADFFNVLYSVLKIIIVNIVIIGILGLISKEFLEETLLQYIIVGSAITICMCFSAVFLDNQSKSETTYSDYTYTSSYDTSDYISSSTSSSDSKYCEAYGCAREKEPGYRYCDKHLENPNWQPSYAQYSDSSSSTYSKYHKCEYPGCTNYASETKYCSKHNQTKCSKPGCSKKEAYQGAGLCEEHLYEEIQKYIY